MNIRYKLFFIFLFVFGFCTLNTDLSAQDKSYEELLKEMEANFNVFAKENDEKFNSFVEENDKNFSEFLRNAWEEQNLLIGEEPPNNPKPEDTPKIDPIEIKKKEATVVIEIEEEVEVELEAKKEFDLKPIRPNIQKKEPVDFTTNFGSFNFYGRDVKFNYDKRFANACKMSSLVDESAISDFWTNLSDINHYHFLNQMLDYKTDMNLNDWGFYLLLKNAAESITTDKNSSNLLVWYMMSKSRYKVKVGYNSNNVHLLVASSNMMYGRRYYIFDNEKYFLMDADADKIYTYKKNYPDSKFLLNLDLMSPVNLGLATKSRRLTFSFEGKDYSFPIEYNSDCINFYNDYPQADIKVYFDASISPTAKDALISNLTPLIKDKTELEAANLLIRFVQTAFDYKTDQQQFNKEKFFFPEELFYYPYSDCEDRSVLYAFLVKELLDLKVVGLAYPGHMATAVSFEKDYGMDHFMYNGKKYVITDPTYINAPVGMCMPKFVDVKAKIVELENVQNENAMKKNIWNLAMKSGINRGGNNADIVFDKFENAYIAGYFNGETTIDGKKLTSKKYSNDIVVAKFDKKGKVLWAISQGGEGSDIASALTVDDNGNVYVTGTFNKNMVFDTNELQSNGIKDVFIIKLNNKGELQWVNKMDIEKPNPKTDQIYVSSFDTEGNHKSTMMFDETENFDSYGITLDDTGACYVTAAFSAIGEGNVSDALFNASAGYNFGDDWKAKNDAMLNKNYISPMAGLFAFMNTIRPSGAAVTGQAACAALDKYNPNFKKIAPNTYNNIQKIAVMKNTNGIITFKTKNQADISFSNLVIKDNAKMKITTYKGGNAQVTVMSGVAFGKSLLGFGLNFVKMVKTTGNLVFDYDDDHSQKQLNLNKILK